MKTMKKNTTGRVLARVALLLLLATVLTSCGGCGSNKVELTVQTIDEGDRAAAKDAFKVEASEGVEAFEGITCGLSATELNTLAQLLSSAYSTSFDSQELMVAAYRGHNMLAADFNDKNVDPNASLPVNVDAAKAVIAKATTLVKDDTLKVSAAFYENMNEADVLALVNAMKSTVDLNSKGGFLQAIGTGLKWITKTVGFGSYIVGICIFAIIIEACMLPFSIKQQKNSIKQASLRPKEMAIRNKYKNRNDAPSQQKMQQEIQEFYQRENFNPYKGCMPLLIQLPIIMVLYNIVINPLQYVLGQTAALSSALASFCTTSRAAGGMGITMQQVGGNNTIERLSVLRDNAMSSFEGLKNFLFYSNGESVYNSLGSIKAEIPNFNIGSLNFGAIPSFNNLDNKMWILLLVPVLTFVVYFFSSKVTRKLMNTQPPANSEIEKRQMACSNATMDIMMPLMSTYFTFILPAVMGVYWVFRCLLNMLKQYILAKAMPLPVFTEEDYKAAAKEMAGKRTVVKKSSNVGKVRSLHHIDDEDFDDTRDKALARKAAIAERERTEQAQKAEETPVAAAPIKEDKNPKSAQKEEPVQDEILEDAKTEDAPIENNNNEE